jgi:hypothetical protein
MFPIDSKLGEVVAPNISASIALGVIDVLVAVVNLMPT